MAPDERDHGQGTAQLAEHGAHRRPGHPVGRGRQQIGTRAHDDGDDAHDGVGHQQPLRVGVGQHDALGCEPDALEDDADGQEAEDRASGGGLPQRQRGGEELERGRSQGADTRGEQDGEHRDTAQPQGQIVAHAHAVAGGRFLTHACEQGGDDRGRHQRLRQHVDQLGVVVQHLGRDDLVRVLRGLGHRDGLRAQVRRRDVAEEDDPRARQGPQGHLRHVPQTHAPHPPYEARTESRAHQGDIEDEGLGRDARRRRARDEGDATRVPDRRILTGGVAAVDVQVGDDRGDRDDVVEHR